MIVAINMYTFMPKLVNMRLFSKQKFQAPGLLLISSWQE